MKGVHFIKSWSKTQATVALSSGEAELQGMVKAAAEGIAKDLGDGIRDNMLVYADASAALGMVARQGVGRIRHLDTRLLWVQESNVRYGLSFSKIRGTQNPADAFTKHVSAEGLQHMLCCSGMKWQCGRPGVVPGPAWPFGTRDGRQTFPSGLVQFRAFVITHLAGLKVEAPWAGGGV